MKITNYADIPVQECGESLADLSDFPFLLEPVQFRKGFTKNPQLWLRQTLASKLQAAQREMLEPKGLCFKIYDAWRPRDVQNKVYATCWNELSQKNPEWSAEQVEAAAAGYVINGYNEKLIPPHTTGGAVDLTLAHSATGQELNMGSQYCEWRDFRTSLEAGTEIAENQRLLLIACLSAGLVQDGSQWWHFDFGNQKWAALNGFGTAIYGEVTDGMGFMRKGAALGHGVMLSYELR